MLTIYRFLLSCLAAGIFFTAQASAGDWSQALPGATFVFPRDHFAHRDYRTEWWYVTGTLAAADGRRFGYQFTIFRRGIRNLSQRNEPTSSHLIVNDLPLGHFTLTDELTAKFFHKQLLSRGIFDQAGFDPVGGHRLAWIDVASLE